MEKSTDSEETPRDDLSVGILRYLLAHPSAKDTLDGIEKWWLTPNISREGKRKIEEALNRLAAKGWLIARASPQSETIYSLNKNCLEEIKAFLNKRLAADVSTERKDR